jgi:hypothetical protein
VGGFFAHNFVIAFTGALFISTFILDVDARRRGVNRAGIVKAVAAGSIALALLAGFSLLGIRSISAHLGEGDEASIAGLASALAGALTGVSDNGSILLIAAYSIAFVVVAVLAGRSYQAELIVAFVITAALIGYYLLIRPRFFIDRFMIWLPLVWIILLGMAVSLILLRLRPRFRPLAAAISGGALILVMLPSQVTWQNFNRSDVDLRLAADETMLLTDKYEAQGNSVGYLLLSSYGNYGYRLWFYFPESSVVSDRTDTNPFVTQRVQLQQHDIWFVPTARDQLASAYAWIPGRAVESSEAGNVTIYVVTTEALLR